MSEHFPDHSTSPMALARVEGIGELLGINSSRVAREIPEADHYRFFLREQSLGYYDEFEAALHGDSDGMKAFFEKSVEQDPWKVIEHPSAFREYLESDKLRLIYQGLINSKTGYVGGEFNKFCYATDQAHWENAANKVYLRHGLYGRAADLSCLIRYASLPSDREKAAAFEKRIGDDYFWQEFYLTNLLPLRDNDHSGTTDAKIFPTALNALKELVEAGVIDTAPILKDLDERVGYKHQYEHGHSEYLRMQGVEAKLILTITGILAAEETGTVEAQVDHFIESTELDTNRTNEIVRMLAALTKHGYYPADKARNIVANISLKDHTHESDFFERLLRDGEGRSYPEGAEHFHNNDVKITELYDKYVVNRDENTTFSNSELYRYLQLYDGELMGQVQEILVSFGAAQKMPVSSYFMKQYRRIFADQPERLNALFKTIIESEDICEDLDYDGWEEWADLAELSRDDAKAIFLKALGNATDYEFISLLADCLAAHDPLLTQAECGDIIGEYLAQHELEDYTFERVVEFCKQNLGTELTREKIFPAFKDHPTLLTIFERNRGTVLDAMASNELHETITNCYWLADMAHYLERSEVDAFITKATTKLPPEHLADVLIYIWDFMRPAQKEAALETIYANPALLMMSISNREFRTYITEVGHDRMLPATPTTTQMESLAPKASSKMYRRLASKILPHHIQLERTNDMRLAPPHLEAGRGNVLINYAYYGDLSHRLRNFSGADNILSRIRGRSTGEQNELRTLELLTLLHESAGITNENELAQRNLGELEEMATLSVLSAAGLPLKDSRQHIDNLREENMDLVKYSMWLHTSLRSDKLREYLGDYLEFAAAGHSLADWKFDRPRGNNLHEYIPIQLQQAWRNDHTDTLGTHTLSYTHDLQTALMIGAQPVNNCLHYAYGLNQHAVAGLFHADVKILNITKNDRRSSIANAILRLSIQKSDPVVTIEPLYSNVIERTARDELLRTVVGSATQYTESLGIDLRIAYDRNHEMHRAAKLMWNQGNTIQKSKPTLLMPSLAPFSYNDSNGLGSKKVYIATIGKEG